MVSDRHSDERFLCQEEDDDTHRSLIWGKPTLKHFFHSRSALTSAIRTEQSLPDTGQDRRPDRMAQAGLRLDWSSPSPKFWRMIISPKDIFSGKDTVGSVSWGSEAHLGKSELTMPKANLAQVGLETPLTWHPMKALYGIPTNDERDQGYTTGCSAAMTLPREIPGHMSDFSRE